MYENKLDNDYMCLALLNGGGKVISCSCILTICINTLLRKITDMKNHMNKQIFSARS